MPLPILLGLGAAISGIASAAAGTVATVGAVTTAAGAAAAGTAATVAGAVGTAATAAGAAAVGTAASVAGAVGSAATAAGAAAVGTAASVAGAVGSAATAAGAAAAGTAASVAGAVGTAATAAGTTATTLGAAAIGAGTGAVVVKIQDMKKAEQAYEKGINDASEIYETKFTKQAEEFNKRFDQMMNNVSEWKKVIQEKDMLLQECMIYIKDLEKERDYLKKQNRELSEDKRVLLKNLRFQMLLIESV